MRKLVNKDRLKVKTNKNFIIGSFGSLNFYNYVENYKKYFVEIYRLSILTILNFVFIIY